MRFNLAGDTLTRWLQKLLNERGHEFTTLVERQIVYDIKEKVAYVVIDYEAELQRAAMTTDYNINYTLPDLNEIVIAYERFRCLEFLFKPAFNEFAIDQTLFDSIMKCDIAVRKDLYANIVLSGGMTMFAGLPERIEKEMIRMASPERKHAAWIGGSNLSSLAIFPQIAIRRDEYNDESPCIVYRKCP
jgi:actin